MLPQTPAVMPGDDWVSRTIKIRKWATKEALIRTAIQDILTARPHVGLGHTQVACLDRIRSSRRRLIFHAWVVYIGVTLEQTSWRIGVNHSEKLNPLVHQL